MIVAFNTDLIVLGTAISAIAILGFVVLFQDPKSDTTRAFFVFSLAAIIWGVINYASYHAPTVFLTLWLCRLVIFAAVWFCFFIFHLAYVFPQRKTALSKRYKYILIPVVTLSSLLTLTPLVFSNVTFSSTQGSVPVIVPGIGIPIFGLTVLCLVCAAIYEFLNKQRKGQTDQNYQLGFIMGGTAITFALLILCNLILPIAFGQYVFIPFGAVFIFPFIACTAYAIIRFHLFSVRVIATEIFAFTLTIATLLQVVFSSTAPELIFRIAIFILVLSFVILLIRSVLNEVRQREHIQLLADQLEKANKQQVVLIHFITHQIKGFVTKSRNLFSMLLEGDYGTLPDTMRPMVEEGLRSDTQGVETIQEILNASNVKSGAVTYNMALFDFGQLVDEITNGLRPNAETKKLTFTVDTSGGPYQVNGDRLELQNAIKNIVDNAIKYTPSGSVSITLKKDNDKLRFEETDTGVGITAEDMAHLFTEGGHGKESIKVNVESTGFGLYIVKNIINAHNGKVWAESEGAGKGSKFIIELPLSQ